MEFLKKIFDDDSKVIGLCSFKKTKKIYKSNPVEREIFFNPFEKNMSFAFNYETNFKNNVLLL